MSRAASGHIERLPSGSFRVDVYAGTDSLTGKRVRFRRSVKTEQQARIELGKLIEQATSGRRPDSAVIVAELLDQYMTVAELDVSTRESYEGYIRRTILPALGSVELRKVRGPVLDTLYARLRRCGDVSCTGRSFVEHSRFPVLTVSSGGRRPAWEQVAETIREAVGSGRLTAGEQIPSVRELGAQYGLRTSTLQHALRELADEGLVSVRQGRRAVVAGAPEAMSRRGGRAGTVPGHDCMRVGCRPHQCRPMAPKTIRNIHSILSGAFAAAVRWEWIDRNPAESAKLPKAGYRPPTSPTPEAVAKVIAAARETDPVLGVYLWLASVTGARRGELCGLQWADLDLDAGVVHIAWSYLVRDGQKLRKDTKTHQDRHLAIDPVTCSVLRDHRDGVAAALAAVGVELTPAAYVFSNDPAGTTAWNPDWGTHKVAEIAAATGVRLNIKALRHYTASQLLAGGIDLRNTAARLGHGSGGATTLRHYADPVSEVDRRAAAYLAQLTAPVVAAEPARTVSKH